MIDIISRPEIDVCLNGCDTISVTYQLVGEEPVTVEVERIEGNQYLFSINGLDYGINYRTAIPGVTDGFWRAFDFDDEGNNTVFATFDSQDVCPFGIWAVDPTFEGEQIFESFVVEPVCSPSKWYAVHHPIVWELQRKDAISESTSQQSGQFRIELDAIPNGVVVGTKVDFYDTNGVMRTSIINNISGDFIRINTTFIVGVVVDYVIFPDTYRNYYIETSVMDDGTNEIAVLRTTPLPNGQATVDVHSALKTLATYENNYNYSSLTAIDTGLSGKYKLRFRECYNFTKQAYGSLTDFYYWSNSAKQIRDLYGSNMGLYVGNLNVPCKFLSVFERPTNFIGFPFSLSYIVGGEFAKQLRKNEGGTYTFLTTTTLNNGSINRLKVSDTAESVLIEYGIPDGFGGFIKQGNLTETKQIKINSGCIQNAVALSWLNTLGGREHWVFGYNQTHGLETSQGATFEPYITDLQNSRSNIFDIEKFAQPNMTLGATVDIEDIEGLKTILYSVCVEMYVNSKWIGVRPQTGSFVIRESRDTNADIELTIDLPFINIQSR